MGHDGSGAASRRLAHLLVVGATVLAVAGVAACGTREDTPVESPSSSVTETPDASSDGDAVTWSYGDDPALDELWDACDAGDDGACDELYASAPAGSDYEYFGDTCGGRSPSGGICATETTEPVPPSPDASASGVPSGEIWQWAFGQNVWEDPLYTLSQEQSFSPGSTDIYANTLGFSLTPDEQGDVVVVTLFNRGTGMEAYSGELPGGLDWSMTGGVLLDAWGAEALSGGYGIPYEFAVVSEDGYELTVSTTATEEEDLATSAISSITVRPAQ